MSAGRGLQLICFLMVALDIFGVAINFISQQYIFCAVFGLLACIFVYVFVMIGKVENERKQRE